jgi:hypothetical protein
VQNVLEFKPLPEEITSSSAQTLVQNPHIFVTIVSPSHGTSRTVQVASNSTIKQVMELFLEKNPVRNPNEYGIVHLGTKKKLRGEPIFLDNAKKISDYCVNNMVRNF